MNCFVFLCAHKPEITTHFPLWNSQASVRKDRLAHCSCGVFILKGFGIYRKSVSAIRYKAHTQSGPFLEMVLKEELMCHTYVSFLFWWVISPLNHYVVCKRNWFYLGNKKSKKLRPRFRQRIKVQCVLHSSVLFPVMKERRPLSVLRIERQSMIFILYKLQPIFPISHSKKSSYLPDLPTLIFPRTAIRTLGMFVISSVFMLVILVVYRRAEPLKRNEHKLYLTSCLLSFSLSLSVSLSLVTQQEWRRIFRTGVHIVA